MGDARLETRLNFQRARFLGDTACSVLFIHHHRLTTGRIL